MSYPYVFDYSQDTSVAGYSGPTVTVISDGNNIPGIINPVDNRLLIRTAVARIIGTRKGSRVMRPEFGNDIFSLLFEPIDSGIIQDIRQGIIDTLNREEPRIIIQLVDISANKDTHTVECVIQYRYRNTGKDDSFAFSIS